MRKVIFVPKNIDQPVRVIHQDINDFSSLTLHEVIHATLPCGLEFAIDAKHMQMGWKHALVPWSTYAEHHIHQLRESTVVEPQVTGHQTVICAIKGQPSGLRMRQSAMDTVVHGLSNQLDSSSLGQNVRKLLQLKGIDFGLAHTTIVTVAKLGLSHLIDLLPDDARPICAFPRIWSIPSPRTLSGRFAWLVV